MDIVCVNEYIYLYICTYMYRYSLECGRFQFFNSFHIFVILVIFLTKIEPDLVVNKNENAVKIHDKIGFSLC